METNTEKTHYTVDFRGTTKEYFGIWIVNVLLSIATLGIYSAWAKVRDKKYMYGNTFIGDNHFDYHATGKQILIGRLIVASAFIIMSVASVLAPILYLFMLLLIICVLGFIISRSMRFNARVTSFRNVRFDFTGEAGEAFVIFVLLPIANIFTLNFLYPIISREKHNYLVKYSQYGDRLSGVSTRVTDLGLG